MIALALCTSVLAAEREIEVRGKQMIARKPPFIIGLPADFRWAHSSSLEHPNENSMTRVYIFTEEKSGQLKAMIIVQIADKTDPMADPMTVPPLKADSEDLIYSRGSVKKGARGIEYLIQLIAWNPKAPSLQPLLKDGIGIPPHLALQGQILFGYSGVHAVLIKYSRDVNSFGTKVSGRVEAWKRESLSRGEKKVEQAFEKDFMGMIQSLTF